jgi:electron transfer flavoprotein alpha/beta subunit
MTDLNIIALVSVGAHPTSGRARRAEQDARAVELGLNLAGNKLEMLHAGNPDEEALRAYLGMGLDEMAVLEQPPGADALPVLADYLRHAQISAQCFFVRVAGVQHLQLVAGQVQAQFNRARVLFGAARTPGRRVGADRDQGNDVEISHGATP